MKLSELGEFGLIELIRRTIAESKNTHHTSWKRLLVDIGDDAAVWISDGQIQMATTDTLVQDIHFDSNVITWEELGWKALAVNLSDIAAMGGLPRYALLSLALPSRLEEQDIRRLVTGVMQVASEFEVAVVGGDLSAAPNIVITVTVIGCSTSQTTLKRSTALPGQQIALTGYTGLSAAGLAIIKGKTISDPMASNTLRRHHLHPTPRIREGQILVEQGVKTAIDISDGLVADLGHICESSHVCARIDLERVPVHPMVREHFSDYRDLTLHGGEDYELLFTADETTMTQASRALPCHVAVIGEITGEKLPQQVTVVDARGEIAQSEKTGWEHFRNEAAEANFAQS